MEWRALRDRRSGVELAMKACLVGLRLYEKRSLSEVMAAQWLIWHLLQALQTTESGSSLWYLLDLPGK